MDGSAHNPYAAPSASLVDAGEASDELELAERSTRLGAFLIDGLIQACVTTPVLVLTGIWANVMAQQVSRSEIFAWVIGAFLVAVCIQAYPLHQSGQTWGKRALGIRTVNLDGRKPDLLRLVARRMAPIKLGGAVPFAGGALVMINALMIFRADRRCLHDLIAGTRVVKIGAISPPIPPATPPALS